MSMTDPIADMLTRIRNANAIRRNSVDVPRSRLKKGIADVLKREGYIVDYLDIDAGPQSMLRLELRYGPDGQRVMRDIQRVSKPGRRVYMGVNDIPVVRQGLGVSIVSTPQGVMSDASARAANVGGEVLCSVF